MWVLLIVIMQKKSWVTSKWKKAVAVGTATNPGTGRVLGRAAVLPFWLLTFPAVLHLTYHLNGEENGCKTEKGAGTELGENTKIRWIMQNEETETEKHTNNDKRIIVKFDEGPVYYNPQI